MRAVSEAASFDDFYLATSQRVLRATYALTGDLEEARDCAQEAYERAWRRWGHVDAHPDPEAWVRSTARRLAVSRWRRSRVAVSKLHLLRGPESLPAPSDDHVLLVAVFQQLERGSEKPSCFTACVACRSRRSPPSAGSRWARRRRACVGAAKPWLACSLMTLLCQTLTARLRGLRMRSDRTDDVSVELAPQRVDEFLERLVAGVPPLLPPASTVRVAADRRARRRCISVAVVAVAAIAVVPATGVFGFGLAGTTRGQVASTVPSDPEYRGDRAAVSLRWKGVPLVVPM